MNRSALIITHCFPPTGGLAVDLKDDVLSDAIVYFPWMAGERDECFFRVVEFYDRQRQRVLRFLGNHLELAPETVAKVSRERWRIELFFKSLKQDLKSEPFLGTSRNAVMTQMWTAPIAMLLLRYLPEVVHVRLVAVESGGPAATSTLHLPRPARLAEPSLQGPAGAGEPRPATTQPRIRFLIGLHSGINQSEPPENTRRLFGQHIRSDRKRPGNLVRAIGGNGTVNSMESTTDLSGFS